ncbi:MAG: phosphoadenylyl-sulfate reductase [Pseudomonadota bacterium]
MVQLPEQTKSEVLLRTLMLVVRDHGSAAFSSSLSAEDMVVTDTLLSSSLDIEIFTIDTGRLHADTIELLDDIRRRYNYDVRVYTPDGGAVSNHVAQYGPYAFYADPELRRECCRIRKVEPLKRALSGKNAWITGLRRDSAASRASVPLQEYDSNYALLKFNPIAEWSDQDVWDYLRAHAVPYNRLYDQGYRSIGCAPCTRPSIPGEDPRAGRWWWEQIGAKECGLHVAANGRLVRAGEIA